MSNETVTIERSGTTTGGAQMRPSQSRAQVLVDRIGAERIGFFLIWAAVFAYFAVRLPETYASSANISTMLSSQANLLILALAVVLPLTAGDFDLSVAGVAGLSAVIVGVLNGQHDVPIGLAVLAALATGAAVGVVNILLVVVTGADSIVVTLGMATFLGGLVLWFSDAQPISGISDGLVKPVIVYRLFDVPLVFYYALVLCIVLWYVQTYTAVGRRILFTGQSREVARLSGIRVNRLRGLALVCGSVIASFAGVVSVGVSGAADPNNAPGLLLPAFAAAFLGSAALLRGRFGAWGCFFAVYFLVCGITGLQQLGAQTFVQDLFYGGALVVAVTLARVSERRRGKKGHAERTVA